MQIRFEIPGPPKGKARHRTTKSGHSYTPKETVRYENLVRLCFTAARQNDGASPEPWTGPVWLDVEAVFSVPASWPRWKTEKALLTAYRHCGRPDLDNVVKAVLDGLNGVAYKDDAQVCAIQARKRYGKTPRVKVMVTLDAQATKGD